MSLGLLWGAERGSRAWHLPKVPRLRPNSRSGAGKTVRAPGKQEAAPKPAIPALDQGVLDPLGAVGAFSSRTHSQGDAETRSAVCLAGSGAPSEMRSTPRPRSARSPAPNSLSPPWPPPGLPRSSLFRFRMQADLLHAEKRRGEVFQASPPHLAGLRPPRDLRARSPQDLACRRPESLEPKEKMCKCWEATGESSHCKLPHCDCGKSSR